MNFLDRQVLSDREEFCPHTAGYCLDEPRKRHLEDPVLAAIIWAIIIGAIIGALGRLVVPGRQNMSILLTIVVGIVAALLGTVIARALGVAQTSGFDWIEHIIQVVLAALGVLLVTGFGGRRRSTY